MSPPSPSSFPDAEALHSIRTLAFGPRDIGDRRRSTVAVCVSATYNGLAANDTISQAEPTLCMKAPTSETISATSSRRRIGVDDLHVILSRLISAS
jgi:hypothetical protein